MGRVVIIIIIIIIIVVVVVVVVVIVVVLAAAPYCSLCKFHCTYFSAASLSKKLPVAKLA